MCFFEYFPFSFSNLGKISEVEKKQRLKSPAKVAGLLSRYLRFAPKEPQF